MAISFGKSAGLSRRALLKGGAALGLTAAVVPSFATAGAAPATEVVWLDKTAPGATSGTTFGVPWPRGAVKAGTRFTLTAGGDSWPVQSWPLAYWPDGSLKWTAHAVTASANPAADWQLAPGTPATPQQPVTVTPSADAFTVTAGDAVWTVAKSGKTLIRSATRAGRPVMGAVTLGALTQDGLSLDEKPSLTEAAYDGIVTKATLEQDGPVRAVIRLEGHYDGNGRQWLPFTVRLYFHAGADCVRIVHSFVFDGDETKDFIRGLSLNAAVPLHDELYNRHVRFSGQETGIWGEAVRSLTGLRRDPGKAARDAQIAGQAVDPASLKGPFVSEIQWIPPWGDFTLSQPNSDGFTITKRTVPGQGWIQAMADHRASGLVYAGGASGGVALGMKDFWQRSPSRLDVRGAATDNATVTAWMWSPDVAPMDLRPYRLDWGMDTYDKQNQGLDITYEDFEPGWDKPYGIARTTEFTLYALAATPERERFAAMATELAKPARLVVSPARLHMAGVFGDWSLIDTSTPTRALIEGRIAYQLDYYISQIEQQRWYGFWNYGNVMHTYDADRHVWRYDIGGFAWDNSELQSDMMFWYGYLRSGRADVFRMAEAMTRQTGEVEVYHIGRWKGFGTRHGVQPFLDSSKQPRVSNAAFKRFYYYLTGDERTGDLMRELNDSDQTLANVYIERKVSSEGGSGIGVRAKIPGTVDCSFGTSWGAFVAAWMTEWERTGDTRWRDRILTGMNSIARLKYGWFAGGAAYDLKTGAFVHDDQKVDVSHLNAVFGIIEISQELLPLVDAPAYKKCWLDYCKYYSAPADEITAFLGVNPRDRSLRDAASRMTAYAARALKDPKLAERAWMEFMQGDNQRFRTDLHPQMHHIAGPAVLHPVDEDPRVSTNGAAQWGLAAIENLELIGDTVETYGRKYAMG
jgi:hypothetical protein